MHELDPNYMGIGREDVASPPTDDDVAHKKNARNEDHCDNG